jgi:hypothetical protein
MGTLGVGLGLAPVLVGNRNDRVRRAHKVPKTGLLCAYAMERVRKDRCLGGAGLE